MASAQPRPLLAPNPPHCPADRWRWPRALLILPLPLWLIVQARHHGVTSPLLDHLDPRALQVLAVLAVAVLCHVLAGRLTRHGVPRLAAMPLVAAHILALPVFPADRWTLSAIIALTLVVIALHGYLRFVVDGQTLGGFTAGITLALAAACDLTTLGYMAGFAAAVPFVAGPWARDMSATTAILAVLAYPSVATYLGWLYIRWRFDTTDTTATAPAPAAFDLAHSVLTTAQQLTHAPLYVAVAVAVALRCRTALPAYLLPIAVVTLLDAAGIGQAPLLVNLFYTAVAVTAVQTWLPRRQWMALTAVAATQTVLLLIWTPA